MVEEFVFAVGDKLVVVEDQSGEDDDNEDEDDGDGVKLIFSRKVLLRFGSGSAAMSWQLLDREFQEQEQPIAGPNPHQKALRDNLQRLKDALASPIPFPDDDNGDGDREIVSDAFFTAPGSFVAAEWTKLKGKPKDIADDENDGSASATFQVGLHFFRVSSSAVKRALLSKYFKLDSMQTMQISHQNRDLEPTLITAPSTTVDGPPKPQRNDASATVANLLRFARLAAKLERAINQLPSPILSTSPTIGGTAPTETQIGQVSATDSHEHDSEKPTLDSSHPVSQPYAGGPSSSTDARLSRAADLVSHQLADLLKSVSRQNNSLLTRLSTVEKSYLDATTRLAQLQARLEAGEQRLANKTANVVRLEEATSTAVKPRADRRISLGVAIAVSASSAALIAIIIYFLFSSRRK
ncbi:hypothetical protein DFJ73DRAFT_841521 [Zopfochytrium polystomum]|nr:hypothetical protein DFJ73DRAFT_841521 [Zopfochytrium polystomum]